MSNSLRPHGSLTGSSIRGILQARVLEWVAIIVSLHISLLNKCLMAWKISENPSAFISLYKTAYHLAIYPPLSLAYLSPHFTVDLGEQPWAELKSHVEFEWHLDCSLIFLFLWWHNLLVRILQRNRNNGIYIDDRQIDRKSEREREIRGDLLKELAHIVVEAKKTPQSTVCKPENQESQWYKAVHVQRFENQGGQRYNSHS